MNFILFKVIDGTTTPKPVVFLQVKADLHSQRIKNIFAHYSVDSS